MKKIVVVFKDRDKKFWKKISEEVRGIFNTKEVECFWKNTLKRENLKDKELVICIGGDGTFLSASHFINNQLILGINSNYKKSEGALTSTSIKKMNSKLEKISKGKFKEKSYSRIKVKIIQKNKCILAENALNEIYFGNVNPHHTSKYNLKFRGKSENQVSSGVLVSTGTGSSAWYKSMGGRTFARIKKEIRFIVREPYSRRLNKPKIKTGRLKGRESIEFGNFVTHNILAIDSIRKYDVRKGDRIIVSLGSPLKVIV